ncbi:MAG: DUF4136 domain-containing protein [Verrucomicrobia bacterium]|nr:DUF4136 domain-containing protein [Verrucomicrobiota bacterium]
MNFIALPVLTVLSLFLAACGPGVDMPKGTSKGYTSARLTQRDPNRPAISNPTERSIHGMIQDSLRRQFRAKGLAYGTGSADLVVAYLVIYQEPGMTTSYEDYYGYGRPADAITDRAHDRGVIESKRPDYFQRAGIVIDLIDSRTNKLVYRNFATGDVVRGASGKTRAARIDAAVAQALAGFFR